MSLMGTKSDVILQKMMNFYYRQVIFFFRREKRAKKGGRLCPESWGVRLRLLLGYDVISIKRLTMLESDRGESYGFPHVR